MGLAISANSAGVNLQTEARAVYETVNDLMGTMGLTTQAPYERKQ